MLPCEKFVPPQGGSAKLRLEGVKIMYIHDVIASLRERDLKLAKELRSMMAVMMTMERYLSEVSDYPAPPEPTMVSRETEAHDGDPTLF